MSQARGPIPPNFKTGCLQLHTQQPSHQNKHLSMRPVPSKCPAMQSTPTPFNISPYAVSKWDIQSMAACTAGRGATMLLGNAQRPSPPGPDQRPGLIDEDDIARCVCGPSACHAHAPTNPPGRQATHELLKSECTSSHSQGSLLAAVGTSTAAATPATRRVVQDSPDTKSLQCTPERPSELLLSSHGEDNAAPTAAKHAHLVAAITMPMLPRDNASKVPQTEERRYLRPGTELRAGIYHTCSADGGPGTSTCSSPDQGAVALPHDQTSRAGPGVQRRAKTAAGTAADEMAQPASREQQQQASRLEHCCSYAYTLHDEGVLALSRTAV